MPNVRSLFILIALMAPTACSSTAPSLRIEPVQIPAALTKACNEPEDLPDNGNMGDMLTVLIHLAQDYKDCSMRHDALVQVVQKK